MFNTTVYHHCLEDAKGSEFSWKFWTNIGSQGRESAFKRLAPARAVIDFNPGSVILMTVQNPARERGRAAPRGQGGEGDQRRGDHHHVTRLTGGGEIII